MNKVWKWCSAQWKQLSDKYHAQQEVIKKQSEVSHERITAKRAILIFMETWGLGSRNIFYTLWHLLWSPGYMLNDFINGRRKQYLQPFLLFFLLTIILVNVAKVVNVELPQKKMITDSVTYWQDAHPNTVPDNAYTPIMYIARGIDVVRQWRNENFAMDILIHSFWLMFMIWLCWRKSPRVGKAEWEMENGESIEGYNFAEMATVTVYILCQLQVISILAMAIFHNLPFDYHADDVSNVAFVVLFMVFFVDFKQLFQRGWWDTLWRTFLIVLFV